uniref:Uncharacterized protein n=1 Tax=Amblyomma tuberculatum TaxID=48802 RepID=A0A6M2E4D0_9ACAR
MTRVVLLLQLTGSEAPSVELSMRNRLGLAMTRAAREQRSSSPGAPRGQRRCGKLIICVCMLCRGSSIADGLSENMVFLHFSGANVTFRSVVRCDFKAKTG